MFGFVTANQKELPPEQLTRYRAVYCGICRGIRAQASQEARLCLSYDMAFLGLLLMSLYEPEETSGVRACALHPLRPRPWVDNGILRYCADMNVALAYYQALDDKEDEHRLSAAILAGRLEKHMQTIQRRYPRQCEAMARCITRLQTLEKAGCANPDEPAGCFGDLMAELFVLQEDMWAGDLRAMGQSLGRFIYLLDAAVDYRKDKRRKRYNPYLAMGMEENWPQWEQHLVRELACCTRHYEHLPLVQDKALLDAILYSGVWMGFERAKRSEVEKAE